MPGKKLDLLKKVVIQLLKGIPKESFIIWGISGKQGFKWLNNGTPLQIASEAIQERLEKDLNLVLDECQEEEYPMDISAALLASLEMRIPGMEEYARSVIILGTGTICNKGAIQSVIKKSLRCYSSRVSAIGIGNGSSDSFLRLISSNGLGGFESIFLEEDVEKADEKSTILEAKISKLMKQIRKAEITNLQFDTSEDPSALIVLPVIEPENHLLKGSPIQVIVYHKKKPAPDSKEDSTKEYSITMKYDDLEGKKTQKSIKILLKPSMTEIPSESDCNLPGDLHKYLVSRLLMNASHLKASGKDQALVDAYGPDWVKQVILEHQILTEDSAFLLVAENVGEDFDLMKSDVSSLKRESNLAKGPTKEVRRILPEEVLKSTSKQASHFGNIINETAPELLKKDYSKVSFSKDTCQVLSLGVKREIDDEYSDTDLKNSISDIKTAFTEDFESPLNNQDIYKIIVGLSEDSATDTEFGAGKSPKHPNPSDPRYFDSSKENSLDEGTPSEKTKPDKGSPEKPPVDVKISILPANPPHPDKLAEFLIASQQADGSWQVNDDKVIAELGVDRDHLTEAGRLLGVDIDCVFLILCMTFLEDAKLTEAFKKCMLFMLKKKKVRFTDHSKSVRDMFRPK